MNFNLLLRIPVMRANWGMKIFTQIFFGMGPLVSPLCHRFIIKIFGSEYFWIFYSANWTCHKVVNSLTVLLSQIHFSSLSCCFKVMALAYFNVSYQWRIMIYQWINQFETMCLLFILHYKETFCLFIFLSEIFLKLLIPACLPQILVLCEHCFNLLSQQLLTDLNTKNVY